MKKNILKEGFETICFESFFVVLKKMLYNKNEINILNTQQHEVIFMVISGSKRFDIKGYLAKYTDWKELVDEMSLIEPLNQPISFLVKQISNHFNLAATTVSSRYYYNKKKQSATIAEEELRQKEKDLEKTSKKSTRIKNNKKANDLVINSEVDTITNFVVPSVIDPIVLPIIEPVIDSEKTKSETSDKNVITYRPPMGVTNLSPIQKKQLLEKINQNAAEKNIDKLNNSVTSDVLHYEVSSLNQYELPESTLNHNIETDTHVFVPDMKDVITHSDTLMHPFDFKKVSVKHLFSYGALVEDEDGQKGLIHISNIRHGFVDDVSKYFKIGDETLAEIIGKDDKGLSFSTKNVSLAPKKRPDDLHTREIALLEKHLSRIGCVFSNEQIQSINQFAEQSGWMAVGLAASSIRAEQMGNILLELIKKRMEDQL